MLTRNVLMRGICRLMTVFFAVQIIVGSLCLLTTEAHAMPQSVQNMVLGGNCAKSTHANQGQYVQDQQTPDHSDACYHCDQPAQLSNANHASVVPVALVFTDVISLPVAPLLNSQTTGLFSSRTPTGPPRSSSLLYKTSQRILI